MGNGRQSNVKFKNRRALPSVAKPNPETLKLLSKEFEAKKSS